MAFPWMTVAGGLLGGIFSGEPETQYTPGYRFGTRQLKQLTREELAYARGVPGSDPQEMAALAQAKGLASGSMANQQQALLAALGPGGATSGNAADALSRFGSNVQGQFAGMDMAALLASISNRRQARQNAAGMAGALRSGGPMQTSGGSSFGPMLAQLAQAISYQQALKGMSRTTAAPPTASGVDYRQGPGAGVQAVADRPDLMDPYGNVQVDPGYPQFRARF